MEEKSSGKGLEKFLAGKGFYIVLFLCVAIIGVSAWSLATGGAKEEAGNDMDTTLENGGAISGDFGQEPEPVAPTIVEDEPNNAEDPPATAQTGIFKQGDVWKSGDETCVMPVEGETQRAYSVDKLQYDATMADWRTHDAVDIAADKGTAVKAAHGGTVKSVDKDKLYGTTVVIDQGGGVQATYAGLTETPTVKAGDDVSTGDVIGYVGDTAICESTQASHLHFAMTRDGESVDPMEFIK